MALVACILLAAACSLVYALVMQQATVSQKRFAQGIALGKPATVAYKLAHPGVKLSPRSLSVAASKSKKTKAVQEELAKLLAEPMLQPLVLAAFAEAFDERRLREHAVGIMVRLTSHPDPQVQFHAATWIYEYAKQLGEERKSKPKPETREQLLANLRGIYSKSLPRPEMIVEAVSEQPVSEPIFADPVAEETGWTPGDEGEDAG